VEECWPHDEGWDLHHKNRWKTFGILSFYDYSWIIRMFPKGRKRFYRGCPFLWSQIEVGGSGVYVISITCSRQHYLHQDIIFDRADHDAVLNISCDVSLDIL
jgi:hypothetical protein